jgi:hypothetical protein
MKICVLVIKRLVYLSLGSYKGKVKSSLILKAKTFLKLGWVQKFWKNKIKLFMNLVTFCKNKN